jgi:hypothetical protein
VGDSRVVDQDVDRAEFVCKTLHHARHLDLIPYVGPEGQSLTSGSPDFGSQGLRFTNRLDTVDANGGAFACQPVCYGTPDTP